MKVSVITVTYNSAATLADTLHSVARQTHPDIEHVVVDGASSDGTMELLRREGGHVARTLCERDAGIYDAMNKGIALASGDLIGFLNADDVFASDDSVAWLVAHAQRDAADAVYGDLVYVRERDLNSVVRHWQSGDFSAAALRRGWMPPHPTFYVRRDLMTEVGLFDRSLRIAADYDYMLRCLRRPGVRVARVPHVLVRMRAGGASNRSLKALWRKSSEDLLALRRNGVGGWWTLLCKNARKLPQFLRR